MNMNKDSALASSSKSAIQYTTRERSLITGKSNLEKLTTLHHFPVFIGCTSQPIEQDLRADMDFQICKDSGFIQLGKLLPLELVYAEYHSEALGAIWKKHHEEFAKFILKYSPTEVLEIGGSTGVLAEEVTRQKSDMTWTIVEPVPNFEPTANIKVIKSFFDENFRFGGNVDAIVHSHVLEHLYDPTVALRNIHQFLKDDGLHLFSIPNLYDWLKQYAPNTINFEHTIFLTEYFTDYLLNKYGFEILEKTHFSNHSIFYATKKTKPQPHKKIESKYTEYKKIFEDFIHFHTSEAKRLNASLDKFEGKVYLFGAHIFSQFLIEFGLKTDRIQSILDNSKLKQHKRLYGSTLHVESPEVLRGQGRVCVIMKAGVYVEELKSQFYEINPEIFYI
jgi:2-polyprenyl-3-methyl-5-hydroxy-6-metoxy-1,4-benzoquinol methylase